MEKEKEELLNHEDTALKVTAQFFCDEIMPALHIEGEVVAVLATEGIHLELKKGYEDMNFLMSDDSIKHFEFQSSNEGKMGLKRFRWYEAQISYQQKKDVTTYVLFSGKIKEPMTEFTEGINTYRIKPIIMQNEDADKVILMLQKKLEAGDKLVKADLLPLTLIPLMGGEMSQKERFSAAYNITQEATEVDSEVIRNVEAVIYIMANKFLDAKDMEQFKEEMKMMKLGKMIYDDGVAEGRAEGDKARLKATIQKKMEKGKSIEEIAEAVEESVDTVRSIIQELETCSTL